MKSKLIKTTFCALVLLTPLVTQASNEGHEQRHAYADESNHSQDRYLSQHSYAKTTESLPVALVPEPGPLSLVGAGIIGLFFARRRKI